MPLKKLYTVCWCVYKANWRFLMTKPVSTSQFESEIRAAMATSHARPEFVNGLQARLAQKNLSRTMARWPLRLRVAWAVALAVLLVLVAGTLIIGPQRVYAAVRQLFGYIPGFGIVDQSAPLRVLEERVSITRDGVTVSVNQALLTADQTQIDFGVASVPLSAYPGNEAISGCIEQPYLRLPDGTRMEIDAAIPANVNEVTFALPCIFNTLPGTAPTDWEIPLRFIPAPPDLTVMPVIELTSTLSVVTEVPGEASAQETATPPVSSADVSVERIIETEDGYILVGAFRPQTPEGTWVEVTGATWIRDATGQKVSYSFPEDIELPYDESMGQGGFAWAFSIKGAGLAYPLTIHFSGVVITQVDPSATAEVQFDTGADPQPGQEWILNKEIQLAGYGLRLVSVTARADGYSFLIEPGANLNGVSIQIAGHTALGGGGGVRSQSLVYAELPKGKLIVVLSNPLIAGATQTWQAQWAPDVPRPEWAVTAAPPSTVCLNADTFLQLEDIPVGLDGWMLLTEINPELRLVLSSFDGQQHRVLAALGSRGALSMDGLQVAYPGNEGIVIVDVASGETAFLQGVGGYDLHWSPDGQQIAMVNVGSDYGVFVVRRDGANLRQLSNLGYESIAGWSPDGSELYYAIPDAGGEGWLLKAAAVETGVTRDLFVLKDASRKAPMPAVSPDGVWIAYRAVDNASLYLAGMDSSPARLVLDQPATAINGIVWEKEGHLLGVSLITPETPDGAVILLQIDNCEAYHLPGMHGELDGIIIP
jgi:hypothetical protein